MDLALTAAQSDLIRRQHAPRLLLEGPAGCGKTTAGCAWLLEQLACGMPGEQILVLAPTRALALPYLNALKRPDLPPGGPVTVQTLNGLAARNIELFWPVLADRCGFARPDQPPTFLTLETAQYAMGHVMAGYLRQRFFDNVRIERNRLYSQVLDNLNKAAGVGFSHQTIAERLKTAWAGKPGQMINYDQAQECAEAFRRYCLEHNLLDFSLRLEIFREHLWPSALFRGYLRKQYRVLIYDNIEEDIPVAHDLVLEWLPDFQSAVLITDQDGGYRSFLGADPDNAECLTQACEERILFDESLVSTPPLRAFETAFVGRVVRAPFVPPAVDVRPTLQVNLGRFYPDMVATACREVAQAIRERHIAPSEIVLLAPFVPDSLRFAIDSELRRYGISTRSHRPSRSLRSEPVTRCLLTLAKLAHPGWAIPPELKPTRMDVRSALQQVIDGIDFVRADLMAANLYRLNDRALKPFDPITGELRDRITYTFGNRYEHLRGWLEAYRQSPPCELDLFLARLFGEVLSQPGFTFHKERRASEVTYRLIESVQVFRQSVTPDLLEGHTYSEEYVRVVEEGLLGATFLPSWEEPVDESVLISPAYTYLMSNRVAKLQCWLDIGSLGWWQRLDQPLTQPYVLSRQWNPAQRWTDRHEYQTNQENLVRLVQGLLRRCSGEVRLFAVGVNESGGEERGPLLMALQGLLRQLSGMEAADERPA